MTKLLQSRWTLPFALAAALAVWIGDQRSPQGSTAPIRSRKVLEPEAASVASQPALQELSIQGALREWLAQQADLAGTKRREDPFLEWAEPHVLSPASTGMVSGLPVLRGISLGAGRPLAILDRTVVGEGESLGSWRIDRIESDTVWVEGPTGTIGLTLARDPVLPAAAKAAAPEAIRPKSTDAPSTNPTPVLRNRMRSP
jgi:hypothetical protein